MQAAAHPAAVEQTNHLEEYMKQNCPSITAHKVAMMRAAHQIFDNPKVFEDPIALSIVGTQGVSDIRSEKGKFDGSEGRAAVTFRYNEQFAK
jgi:O-methyltransferase involved in polyketide biosynthesis